MGHYLMRLAAYYSHLNGLEFLLVHKPALWDEVQSVIADTDAEVCHTKVSAEKTKAGRMLYSPISMNTEFKSRFEALGWKMSRTSYWVTEDARLVRKTMQMSPPDQKAHIQAAGLRRTSRQPASGPYTHTTRPIS